MTSRDDAQVIICNFAIQCGKSFLLKNAMAYHLSRGRSCLLTSYDPMAANEWAMTELQPFLAANDMFQDLLFKDKAHTQKMRIVLKNGANFFCKGATIKGGEMESISVPCVMLDEIHLYKNQNAIQAATGRTTRFASPKIIAVSQAEPFEHGQLALFFDRGTASEWCWACPGCQQAVPFGLEMVTWDQAAKTEDGAPDWVGIGRSLKYECPHCHWQTAPTARELHVLNTYGIWQQKNQEAETGHVSYHVSAFAYVDAMKLVREYIVAKKRIVEAGDFELLKTFYCKRLSIPWNNDYELDESSHFVGSDNVEFKPDGLWENTAYIWKTQIFATKDEAPAGAHPLAMCGVDVQRFEGLWAVIRCWDALGSSMLIWCGNLATWDDLHALVERYGLPPSMSSAMPQMAQMLDRYSNNAPCTDTSLLGAMIRLRSMSCARIKKHIENGTRIVQLKHPWFPCRCQLRV